MSKKMNKFLIYDELCHILTDYENGEANEKDLYKILVKIQNIWEFITK